MMNENSKCEKIVYAKSRLYTHAEVWRIFEINANLVKNHLFFVCIFPIVNSNHFTSYDVCCAKINRNKKKTESHPAQ